MQRRDFLQAGIGAVAGAFCADAWAGRSPESASPLRRAAGGRFPLKFAPHFGMFKHSAGSGLVDQLTFAADQGFVAWQDSALGARPVRVQEVIGRTLAALDMELGVFQASTAFEEVDFARPGDAAWQRVLRDIRHSVETARRVGAKWLTVAPGRYQHGVDPDCQAANCIELLKRCCGILEPHELVLVLEPLYWGTSRSDAFPPKPALRPEGICRAVGSPACKLLFDISRQHQGSADLVAKLDAAWPELGYVYSADNPGRKEPGTGEIDFRRLFGHLAAKAFSGIVSMEHGNSRPGVEGEQAVMKAYLAAEVS